MSDDKLRDGLVVEKISQKQHTHTIENATTISNIAAKIGVTPNELVTAYTIPDGDGKCDMHMMKKDFKTISFSDMKEKVKDGEEERRPEFLQRILNQEVAMQMQDQEGPQR